MSPTVVALFDAADTATDGLSAPADVTLAVVQRGLFTVGVSLALIGFALAVYRIALVRRTLHVASFAILLELFYRFAYGGPVSAGVLLSVGETSGQETWELLLGHVALTGGLTVVALAGLYALRVSWRTPFTVSMRWYGYLGVAALLLSGMSLGVGRYQARSSTARLFREELRGTFPFDVITAGHAVLSSELDARRRAPARAVFRFPKPLMVNASERRSTRELYVIVVGETSRRINWSLFGYDRETTPLLDAMRANLIVFDRVTSNATNTVQSIPLALTRATPGDKTLFHSERSIVTLLHQAGFQTFWLSNQARSTVWSNPVSQIALEADYATFPNERTADPTAASFDSTLISLLDEQLRTLPDTAKAVVFLHMEGSHFSYRDRYPVEHGRFAENEPVPRPLDAHQSRLVNEYDNSVNFTDYTMSEIITRLTACQCQSGLLFFSDHGERLFDGGPTDGRFGHGFPSVSREEIEVPFFIFVSDAYRKSNAGRVANLAAHTHSVAQLHNLFETIVDFVGVEYDGRSPELSLFSRDYKGASSLQVVNVNEDTVSLTADSTAVATRTAP